MRFENYQSSPTDERDPEVFAELSFRDRMPNARSNTYAKAVTRGRSSAR